MEERMKKRVRRCEPECVWWTEADDDEMVAGRRGGELERVVAPTS